MSVLGSVMGRNCKIPGTLVMSNDVTLSRSIHNPVKEFNYLFESAKVTVFIALLVSFQHVLSVNDQHYNVRMS